MQLPDFLIAVSGVIFSWSLIPTAYNQFRVKASTIPLTTSLSSIVAVGGVLVAMYMVGWWFAFVTEAISLALWAVIALQR